MRTQPDRPSVSITPTSTPMSFASELVLALAVAFSLPALASCAGKSKRPSTTVTSASTPSPVKPRPPAARAPQPQTATITPQGGGSEAPPSFAPIRFDFDSVALSAEARDELQRVGTWMMANRARVTIEGHADERGTTEYNLALGQQRAEAIALFLSRLGVERARLDTISYGEERPAVDGADENAWAANRRGELQPR